MNILMVNNEYPPIGGGSATVNEEILRWMSGQPEISVTLITSAGSQVGRDYMMAERIRIIALPLERPDIHHASPGELIHFTYKAARKAKALLEQERFSVCLAWSTVPSGAVAWYLAKRCRLPYLVRVSGPDIPGFEARYRWLYPILTPILRTIWRSASAVIAKCSAEARLIGACARGIEPVIIPNGVNASLFACPRPDAPHVPLRLLCVGRLIERKRHDSCIRALHLLRSRGITANLTLVGTGDNEASLKRLVSELGLEAAVIFKGYVSRQAMPAEYAAHDIFLLPSDHESMSVALLEALASGLPAIVSASAADGVIAEPSQGLTLSSTRPEMIAQAVAQILPTWGERAQAARLRATQLCWAHTGQTLIRLLARIGS